MVSKAKANVKTENQGYFEFNIRVGEAVRTGSSEQPAAGKDQSVSVLERLKDPLILKQMQEMALASINGKFSSV